MDLRRGKQKFMKVGFMQVFSGGSEVKFWSLGKIGGYLSLIWRLQDFFFNVMFEPPPILSPLI